MKREIEALVVAKGVYNSRQDVLKKQALNMCATLTTTRYSENANKNEYIQKLRSQ